LVVPLQRKVPGAQMPPHWLPSQTKPQALPFTQWPLASQLYGKPPSHFLSTFGWHSVTTHAPWLHTYGQGAPSTHAPPVQVCGVWFPGPAHCLVPFAQAPVQTPALQFAPHVSWRAHLPSAPQL
jgi:hypothetical protein